LQSRKTYIHIQARTWISNIIYWGRHGYDRMVVGFTTTYLVNQCLSPLKLWVRIPLMRGVLDTLCDQVCQWLATDQWFSPVSSTNKTDIHDIAEILLKVALNIINQQTHQPTTQCHIDVVVFLVFSELWCEVIVRLVDIGEIVDHHD